MRRRQDAWAVSTERQSQTMFEFAGGEARRGERVRTSEGELMSRLARDQLLCALALTPRSPSPLPSPSLLQHLPHSFSRSLASLQYRRRLIAKPH